MTKKSYEVLAFIGMLLSACAIVPLLIYTVESQLDFNFESGLWTTQDPVSELYLIELLYAVRFLGSIIAIIGCFLCLLCSLILKMLVSKKDLP